MFAALLAVLPLLAITSASPIAIRQTSVLIESGRNPGQCLSALGGRIRNEANPIGNATPVVTLDCAVASYWDISKGSGSVLLSGTNYALDIGLTPSNNGNVKVYQSYPTAPQQTWYLIDDNRIAQTGGTQCLDQGDNGPQTYECTTGNTNQVWNVKFNKPTIVSSSSGPAVTVVSSSSGPAIQSALVPAIMSVVNHISSSSGPIHTVVSSSFGPIDTVASSSSGPIHAVVVSSSGPAQSTITSSSAGPARPTIMSSSVGPAQPYILSSSVGPAVALCSSGPAQSD